MMYLSTLILKFLFIFGLFVYNWTPSFAAKGTLSLDSWTFDKVLNKFKLSLVKFDIPYPYGEKDEEFGKVAQTLKNDDVLVAEVGVHEYGDKENLDLAERYGVKKDDFPVVKLFYGNDINNPISFPADEEFKADKLKRFLKQKTGIKILLEKCLKQFDDLAIKFMKPDVTNEARNEIFEQAKEISKQLVKEEDKKSADIYIKLMEKVIERGSMFIKSEQERVKNLISGKITEVKKNDMQTRLNILESFMDQNMPEIKKEEL